MKMNFFPWKYLAKLGLDYVADSLLPRLKVNQHILAFFQLTLGMGESSVDILTDSEPDNKTQLRTLFLARCETLLSSLLAGVVELVKESEAKKRIIAILYSAITKLQGDPVETPAA